MFEYIHSKLKQSDSKHFWYLCIETVSYIFTDNILSCLFSQIFQVRDTILRDIIIFGCWYITKIKTSVSSVIKCTKFTTNQPNIVHSLQLGDANGATNSTGVLMHLNITYYGKLCNSLCCKSPLARGRFKLYGRSHDICIICANLLSYITHLKLMQIYVVT